MEVMLFPFKVHVTTCTTSKDYGVSPYDGRKTKTSHYTYIYIYT
jgi:hypothetical protein